MILHSALHFNILLNANAQVAKTANETDVPLQYSEPAQAQD